MLSDKNSLVSVLTSWPVVTAAVGFSFSFAFATSLWGGPSPSDFWWARTWFAISFLALGGRAAWWAWAEHLWVKRSHRGIGVAAILCVSVIPVSLSWKYVDRRETEAASPAVTDGRIVDAIEDMLPNRVPETTTTTTTLVATKSKQSRGPVGPDYVSARYAAAELLAEAPKIRMACDTTLSGPEALQRSRQWYDAARAVFVKYRLDASFRLNLGDYPEFDPTDLGNASSEDKAAKNHCVRTVGTKERILEQQLDRMR